eukprot:1630433-Pleurochrysis_carterae.AAC.1
MGGEVTISVSVRSGELTTRSVRRHRDEEATTPTVVSPALSNTTAKHWTPRPCARHVQVAAHLVPEHGELPRASETRRAGAQHNHAHGRHRRRRSERARATARHLLCRALRRRAVEVRPLAALAVGGEHRVVVDHAGVDQAVVAQAFVDGGDIAEVGAAATQALAQTLGGVVQ